MINLLIYLSAILVGFEWDANPPSDNVQSYKLCAGTSYPQCTITGTVNSPLTQLELELDGAKTWYVFATAKNAIGESGKSNLVIVKPPSSPKNFRMKPTETPAP